MDPTRRPATPLDAAALYERFAGLDKKSKMSNWYDIFSLFGTVRDIFVSDLLRDRVDVRTLVALRQHATLQDDKNVVPDDPASSTAPASPQRSHPDGLFWDRHRYYEYAPPPGGRELWFDYASDVGDGFNPTFHVAQHLAAAKLTVNAVERHLPRGRFLILGGDEVYPSATRERYEQRFIRPYEAASFQPWAPDRIAAPHLFAIPGNHDWYDGLANFMSIFAERRAIGIWRTQQRMSYFAIKLPHDVWIFAIDIGLAGELDGSQVEYFAGLVRDFMPQGGRIILCIAEPDWVKPRPNVQNLRDGLFYFERKLVDAHGPDQPRANVRVILRLAGDLHHYRRHQSVEGPPPSDFAVQQDQTAEPRGPQRVVENITAGGGGAFLHPTHELVYNPRFNAANLAEGDSIKFPPGRSPLIFRCRAAFPDFQTSRRLTRQNLGFLFKHGRMFLTLLLVYAPLYHIGIWLGDRVGLFALLRPGGEAQAGDVAYLSGLALLMLVGGMSFLFIEGCLAFARGDATGEIGEAKRGRAQRIYQSRTRRTQATWFGALHGITQSLLWLATLLAGGLLSKALAALHLDAQVAQLASALLGGGLGAALTLLCLGAYLLAAMTWPGSRLHANDAFASLRHEDFKGFLRICLTQDELCIYPIGFRRVPTEWELKVSEDDEGGKLPPTHTPLFVAKNPSPETQPTLIEAEPIRIRLRDEEQGPAPKTA